MAYQYTLWHSPKCWYWEAAGILQVIFCCIILTVQSVQMSYLSHVVMETSSNNNTVYSVCKHYSCWTAGPGCGIMGDQALKVGQFPGNLNSVIVETYTNQDI